MQTGAVSVKNTNNATEPTRQVSSSLGKNEFLKILVAQLQNQDPMSPMEDKDFIAQMAQFSSLEQIQSLNQTMSLSQAYGMVGKTVSAEIPTEDGKDTKIVTGKVDYAFSSKGIAYLQVGGDSIPFSADIAVFNDADNQISKQLLENSNLIGKQVTAKVSSGEHPLTIQGIVEKLMIKDGVVSALVNGYQIKLSELVEISNQPTEII